MKLLGIDVGTSGCKTLLIDEEGNVLHEAAAEYPLHTPRPMWTEQDPEDWWRGVQQCLAQLPEKPDAIGLTGQMHGSVFLDGNDEVIRPALLWNDQRTIAECEEMDRALGQERITRQTLNPPMTGFQAPKILWLRNNEPENFKCLRSVLLPKDYIRLKLTGVKATDVADASGSGLFEVPKRTWALDLMRDLGLDQSLFPPVYESSSITGESNEGTPVIAGGGDQSAAAIGTGAVKEGLFSISLGTSGVVFTSLDQPVADVEHGTHTFCHANERWHVMGVMLSCAGALKWYRDTLRPGVSYDQLAEEAATVSPGADGLVFTPNLSGMRSPTIDPLARGAFVGLTLAHSPAHMSRAVFEGISFGLYEMFSVIDKLTMAKPAELRVTSGGSRSLFWRQLLADIFGLPCVTLRSDEGPAFGAAILAGVGVGVWKDVKQACDAVVKSRERTEPKDLYSPSMLQGYGRLNLTLRDWRENLP